MTALLYQGTKAPTFGRRPGSKALTEGPRGEVLELNQSLLHPVFEIR